MVHELKSRETVVERIAANALNRRALLMKSMAAAGVLGAGAGLDMAKDAANAAQSTDGTSVGNAKCGSRSWRLGRWLELEQSYRGLNAKGVKAWGSPSASHIVRG
jgi:hypothetical protein